MKDILTKIINKVKEFNDSLITPPDFILTDAIMELLGRNPYTSQELNEHLNINNESKVNDILKELVKNDFIRKTDYTDKIKGVVGSSPLYYSLEYEDKFLEALDKKSMTIPDLYRELGCTDEFKIIAMIGVLEPENKIELEKWPEGIETICRDEVINLNKYKRTKAFSKDQKEQ